MCRRKIRLRKEKGRARDRVGKEGSLGGWMGWGGGHRHARCPSWLIPCPFPPLGKMWVFSNLRCGTPEEPCQEAFNQTNRKLGLTYNTSCCNKDNCNSAGPRPTPALGLVFLTSLAGLGLWLLH
ncbi:lymphocyte antigen 6 complex locus protein G6c [Pan paniscus]|uniref:lymphocyte antigen 6 complex locus protein G6c n=1 Tax=Pan paniscus TaxID=9597 RepID=UPI0030049967